MTAGIKASCELQQVGCFLAPDPSLLRQSKHQQDSLLRSMDLLQFGRRQRQCLGTSCLFITHSLASSIHPSLTVTLSYVSSPSLPSSFFFFKMIGLLLILCSLLQLYLTHFFPPSFLSGLVLSCRERQSSVSIQRFILPCQQPNEPWPQQFSCS